MDLDYGKEEIAESNLCGSQRECKWIRDPNKKSSHQFELAQELLSQELIAFLFLSAAYKTPFLTLGVKEIAESNLFTQGSSTLIIMNQLHFKWT